MKTVRPLPWRSPGGFASRAAALLGDPRPHEWILLAAMLALTFRYFSLVDDAFVYFRYADNAVFLGRGLVYNAGERVESFTSPLWMLLLLPLRAIGLDYWRGIRTLSLVLAATMWVAAIWVDRRLHPGGAARINVPLAFLAGHYGVLSSFSSGLETPLVMLAAPVYAGLALRPRSRTIGVLAGLSLLVRHEFALPWLISLAWLSIRGRRVPWPLLLGGALPLLAWFIFRVRYYADLLPNSFYLKDHLDLSHGLAYLMNTLAPHRLQWILPLLFIAGALATLRRASDGSRLAFVEPRLMMLAAAVASAAFAVRVGGDMLYFRFLSFPVCLAVLAMGGVVEQLFALARVGRGMRWLCPAAGIGIAVLSFSAYPAQLQAHPFHANVKLVPWPDISDLAWYRTRESLRWMPERPAEDRARRARYAAAGVGERAQNEVLATGWCRTAFDRFDAYVVHEWGLTDPVLSRMDVRSWRSGHKPALRSWAEEIARMRRADPDHRRPGFYRRAQAAGAAPGWVLENLPALEKLERKTNPDRGLRESVVLAFTPVAPIHVPPLAERWKDTGIDPALVASSASSAASSALSASSGASASSTASSGTSPGSSSGARRRPFALKRDSTYRRRPRKTRRQDQ